jgi:hypothetical protein
VSDETWRDKYWATIGILVGMAIGMPLGMGIAFLTKLVQPPRCCCWPC